MTIKKDQAWPTDDLIVVIPALNEESTIAKVIVGAKGFASRVIVCDDGSTDATGAIARALGVQVIQHEKNEGKGESLRILMSEAMKFSPTAVLTMDGDDQHNPEDIPKVVLPVLDGEADLVIGTRSMNFPEMPMDRIMGNKVLDALASVGAGGTIRDTQSGFRAYSSMALATIHFKAAGMTIESQTIIDAVEAGLKIREVPVSTRYLVSRRKRSRFSHFSEVVDYLLSRTIVGSPILYLGAPGIFATILGVVAGFLVVQAFVTNHQLALGTALLSVVLLLIGAIMVSTSLILKFISAKLEQ